MIFDAQQVVIDDRQPQKVITRRLAGIFFAVLSVVLVLILLQASPRLTLPDDNCVLLRSSHAALREQLALARSALARARDTFRELDAHIPAIDIDAVLDRLDIGADPIDVSRKIHPSFSSDAASSSWASLSSPSSRSSSSTSATSSLSTSSASSSSSSSSPLSSSSSSAGTSSFHSRMMFTDIELVAAVSAAADGRLTCASLQRLLDEHTQSDAAVSPSPSTHNSLGADSQQPRCLPAVTAPFFCPEGTTNFEQWRKDARSWPWVTRGGNFRGETDETAPASFHAAARSARWFCNKLQTNIQPAAPPSRYDESSLVVGLYTGWNIFHTRAIASRDTWLSRLSHVYFYAGEASPAVPVIGLAQTFNFTQSNVNLVQLYGLRDMYERHPEADWFLIVGDDTYVNVDYALDILGGYDASKPQWLTKSFWYDGPGVPKGFNVDRWPAWTTARGRGMNASLGGPGTFRWASGAFGWFLSRPVVRAYSEALDDFLNDPVFPRDCHCPDKMTGMILSMLGFDPEVYAGKGVQEQFTGGAVDGEAPVGLTVPNFTLYHYVFPMKMYSIDQRAVHERIDRLIAAQDVHRLLAFTRRFVDAHYDALRRRHAELRYIIHSEDKRWREGQRWYDVPLIPVDDVPRTQ